MTRLRTTILAAGLLAIPTLAAWIDPARSYPTAGVLVGGALRNAYRRQAGTPGLVAVGDSDQRLQLLAPLSPSSTIAKFLDRNGPGVQQVAYRVEDTRVGQKTDLDRLVLRVWTDGSVSPKEALESAVDTLRSQLSVFSSGEFEEPLPVMAMPTTSSAAASEPAAVGRGESSRVTLESLDLSSRVLHSLQEEGIDSVDALLALSERDLKKVGGVGDKSLEEIKERLQAQGFELKE